MQVVPLGKQNFVTVVLPDTLFVDVPHWLHPDTLRSGVDAIYHKTDVACYRTICGCHDSDQARSNQQVFSCHGDDSEEKKYFFHIFAYGSQIGPIWEVCHHG